MSVSPSGAVPAVIRRRATRTSGPSRVRWATRSSAAACSASSVIGSSASRMNSAVVVSSRSWVRRAWRQFQRRQVTPASSHHTTSPGSGCSITAVPSAAVSKGSVAGGADQPRRTGVAGQVLPAERELVQHRDRVVEVGEPVHPGQPGLRPAQQRLQAVAGALRLGAERPVGLPPRRHVRQLLHRLVAQRLAGRGLRRLQQRLAGLVARARAPARRRPAAGRGSRAAARTRRRRRGRRPGTPRACRRQSSVASDRGVPPRRPARRRPGRTAPAACADWRRSGPRRRGTRPHRRHRG